jgi:hypothetical protein
MSCCQFPTSSRSRTTEAPQKTYVVIGEKIDHKHVSEDHGGEKKVEATRKIKALLELLAELATSICPKEVLLDLT